MGNEILKHPAALSISYTSSLEAQLHRMLGALDTVIIVLIISAGMLAFVVLYNLNNVNITERQRELATLKVLGFYDNEVSAYVYRENVILTLIGVLAGAVFGIFLHRYIIRTVEVDAVMFGRNINPVSFLYCGLLTIGFSMIVNLFMHQKLKKIDMVESLKVWNKRFVALLRKRRNCFSVVFKYVVKRIEWIRGRKGNIIMGTANQIEQELMNYISDHKIRNTHSHHLPEQAMVDFDLDKLINNTYLQWQQVTPGTTAESRNAYLEKTRYKSYFVWLQKAIGELYGISEPITAQNWDQISDQIRKAHQSPDFYMDVLKNKCKYQKVIVDTYWNPGSDNGRPELFTPAFRLDLFFLGYKKGLRNHDGVSLEENFGELPDNLQDYVEWVRKWIIQKKSEGCVALKIAMAYERSLHFEKVTREQAERVFRLKESDITQEDIRCFQDYLFWKICEIAAEVSLPLQCHTGMGQVIDTNILQLNNVIKNNPETKFVLLHCGFPWVDDLFSIVDGYPNLYPDLTWIPILSYTASKRVMHQLIEMSQIDKSAGDVIRGQ